MSYRDRDVFIVGACRTPIGRGKSNGALHDYHPVDLLAHTLRGVVEQANFPPSHVEDVIGGIVSPLREQGANVPRLAALKAGFPQEVPAVQLNRMCGSSQQCIHFASQAIGSGDMDAVIACGVEMMSVVKMGTDNNLMEHPELVSSLPFQLYHQGQSAELICEKYGLTRPELDAFSGKSHEKCAAATKKGLFKNQIIPTAVKDKEGKKYLMSTDEGIRVPVNYDKMKRLPTVFKQNGVVTAANASQVSDGAAAVLLVSGKKLKELNLKPLARVITCVVVGSDPELMLTGPIPATQKALKRANMTINDIDIVEINEAFAPVVLAWAKTLKPDMSKVNPNGGAIAHGHPLGATGCILMTKLVHELNRTGKQFGLETMCIGHGMATCTIVQNCNAVSKL